MSDIARVILNVVRDFPLFTIPLFLCWGSFLNVVAFRLLHKHPFFTKRSYCPSCKQSITWYDLVPVISWLILKGHCRHCSAKISWLYPLIETITTLFFIGLISFVPAHYWLSYGLLFSALIITIRTDLELMLILRICSLWLIPFGIMFSYFGYLPITVMHSILGAALGYGILWFVRTLFWYVRKQEGLGEGDLELLAGIGSFIGPVGVWYTLLYGSIIGSLTGILISLVLHKKVEKLPFGPFLAFGTILEILIKN